MQLTYQRPIIFSIIIHLIIIFLLAAQFNFKPHLPAQAVAANTQAIKAVTVNQAQVAEQVAKLKAEQQAKQQAEQVKQKQFAAQAAAAKRQREQEQQRLTQLKAEAKKLEQQRLSQAKQEAQRLADLKQQQIAEQKKLTELAKQRQVQETKQQQLKQQEQAAKQQQLNQQEIAKQKALQATKLLEQRKAEEDKLLQQQLAAEQQQLDQAKLQAQQSIIAKYQAMIHEAIRQQWIVPENIPQGLLTKLAIQLGPGGVVLDVKLVQSSGNAVLDRSAIAAVRKASPLPIPPDANLWDEFRNINLTVRPEGVA